MSDITYATITAAKRSPLAWQKQGLQQTASGYGNKLTTEYLIQDGTSSVWRRVYCICYSNVGSLYIIRAGKREFIREWELEEKLETTTRITCPQCELARINGVLCHETGCPNSTARYDEESGEWIKQRKCFECGCTVDVTDPCCNEVQE